MSRPTRLDDAVVGEWLRLHPTWRLEAGHLLREIDTIDYHSAVAFVVSLAPTADRLDHHPIITLGYRHLRFELWTHDRAGVTSLDLDYASALDELASGEYASRIS